MQCTSASVASHARRPRCCPLIRCALNRTPLPLAWAARPLAVSEPLLHLCLHRAPRTLGWRSCKLQATNPNTSRPLSTTVASMVRPQRRVSSTCVFGLHSRTLQAMSTKASRSFPVAVSAANRPMPSPSIEGTHSGKLRLPPRSPHVKR